VSKQDPDQNRITSDQLRTEVQYSNRRFEVGAVEESGTDCLLAKEANDGDK
jgi:hypothetical protein